MSIKRRSRTDAAPAPAAAAPVDAAGPVETAGEAGPAAEIETTGAGRAPRPRGKRGYFVPGIIALVVCAGIATLIDVTGLQTRTPSRLAGPQVETFLSQAIQARDALSAPPTVTCPGTEPLRAGVAFSCTVVLHGRTERVAVTEGRGASLTYRLAA